MAALSRVAEVAAVVEREKALQQPGGDICLHIDSFTKPINQSEK